MLSFKFLLMAMAGLVAAQSCAVKSVYTVVSGDYLYLIAEKNGVTVDQILAINNIPDPALIQPGQQINIPDAACVPTAAPKDTTCVVVSNYTVVSGDSLSKIGEKNSVTVAQILAVNNIPNPDLIYPGQIIGIPAPSCVAPVSPATAAKDTTCVVVSNYTVVSGDYLYLIGQKNGVTVAQILAVNNIPNPDLIYPGQIIGIPSPSCVVPASTAPASAVTVAKDSACVGVSNYTVVSGDSLSKIGEKYGVTVDQILAANSISNPDLIYPGQVISIPAPDCVAPVSKAAPPTATCVKDGPATYTVVSGDSLSAIASYKLGITLAALQAANPQVTNPDLIYPGQVLNVPVCRYEEDGTVVVVVQACADPGISSAAKRAISFRA